ncbi:MAG: pantoate--beta-alanine ligase [Chloroflexi bacterium]|nr:pantoate--beta-alanine ligase [Chloroflexota bacterium]|tara:strand:+ start:34342 stop:35211 length:870 start_codon:yes stop_codon:yes gene_type:complete
MKIIRSISEANQFRNSINVVGLVPTMGAIHEGHLSLVRKAKQDCDIVIVTIFTNPIQFSNRDDFSSYPKTIDQDLDFLRQEGVDLVFCPSEADIYPDGFTTSVEVEKFSDLFEGESRPGHFKGVTTIVTKLLNLFLPNKVYFGQKDFQQTFLIQKLNADLNINSEIIVLPTIRESDGLPVSSRNVLLSKDERISASVLYRVLKNIKNLDTFDSKKIYQEIENEIIKENLVELDYVKIVNPDTFSELLEVGENAIILIAINIGSIRLIDNVFIKRISSGIEIDYRFERYC